MRQHRTQQELRQVHPERGGVLLRAALQRSYDDISPIQGTPQGERPDPAGLCDHDKAIRGFRPGHHQAEQRSGHVRALRGTG